MGNFQAIGVDLGTTFSAIAHLEEDGKSVMLRNGEGELLTPSVVLFDDTQITVGSVAKRVAPTEFDRVAVCAKRDMGQKFYSKEINGQQIPPGVIQACILRKLRRDAELQVRGKLQAVITVPAYFDEPRRKATYDAGVMAGWDVLDIVNEPTAAALAFGEQLEYLRSDGAPRETMNVLVYDLGGGTFDATVIRLDPGEIRTLATDGDVQLGGRDWDERLAKRVAEVFYSEHLIDLRQHPSSWTQLLARCEGAKHTLSQRMKVKIHVEHGGVSSDVEITRDEFMLMTEDLLERTAFTTRQVLKAAELEWKDISRLLLVGGSTRMPMVSEKLSGLSGLSPERATNPDEAVARGAALFAGYLLAKSEASEAADGTAEDGSLAAVSVVDVNAHSLGIQGISQRDQNRVNRILIPRNTSLPASATRKFVTQTDGQKTIVIQVLEGESRDPEQCTAIGRSVLRDLPAKLPQGYPVEVCFEYGTNGRLNVVASVPGTGRKLNIDLERETGMTDERLHRWRQLFMKSSGQGPEFEELLDEVLDLLEDEPPAE